MTAYWYFAERKGEPHADISQTAHTIPLANGLIAIEAHILLKNLGQRLLRVASINSRLQQADPRTYDYEALSKMGGTDYWTAQRADGAGNHFAQSELRWPQYEKFDHGVTHVIEPGETDLFVVTFLYRCTDVRHLRVATDVIKPTSKDEEVFAWKARSFVEVATACKAPTPNA